MDTDSHNRQREDADASSSSHKTYRKPIYQTETTGNHWTDLREAAKVRVPTLPLIVSRDTLLTSGGKVEDIAI